MRHTKKYVAAQNALYQHRVPDRLRYANYNFLALYDTMARLGFHWDGAIWTYNPEAKKPLVRHDDGTFQIRVTATEDDIPAILDHIEYFFDVTEISRQYQNQGTDQVRVYISLSLPDGFEGENHE